VPVVARVAPTSRFREGRQAAVAARTVGVKWLQVNQVGGALMSPGAVWAGLHFRNSMRDGALLGTRVADLATRLRTSPE
jgi:hypothetical protein